MYQQDCNDIMFCRNNNGVECYLIAVEKVLDNITVVSHITFSY